MRIDEQISTLQKEYDTALAAALKFTEDPSENPLPRLRSLKAGIDALKEKQEREKPEPLTVEELRKMDGQPVWVEFNSNFTRTHVDPCWMIVYEKENMLQTAYEFVDFGDTGWLAYRYPPKGADAK